MMYTDPKKCDEFLTRKKLTISVLFELRRDQHEVKTENNHPHCFQTVTDGSVWNYNRLRILHSTTTTPLRCFIKHAFLTYGSTIYSQFSC